MSNDRLPLYETNCPNLKLIARGKVRDIYDFGDRLLLVATDRLSAFDVIMSNPIPNKGHVLTYVSKFWFERIKPIIKSHFISCSFNDFPPECEPYRDQLEGRSMLVSKSEPLPVECIVRGYLHGSAVKEYKNLGAVCGNPLPEGLEMQSKLPAPIFTPSTKAVSGHDENITFEQVVELLGHEAAGFIRDAAFKIYQFGHDFMAPMGIKLVDTKFEFGRAPSGEIILIDECMTPDSSRYYETATYQPGMKSVCYDKQRVRDYLEPLDWPKTYPAPSLPAEIIEDATRQYTALLDMLEKSALKEMASAMEQEAGVAVVEGGKEGTQGTAGTEGTKGAGETDATREEASQTAATGKRIFDATVAVTLKPGVFDVQGQTIQQALGHLKHRNIQRLRAGRWFEVQLECESAEAAREQLVKISHDLLSNPVIEDFKINIL